MIGISVLLLVLAAALLFISFCLNSVSQSGGSSAFAVRNELRTLKSILAKARPILQVFWGNIVGFMFLWMTIILDIVRFIIHECISIFNVNSVCILPWNRFINLFKGPFLITHVFKIWILRRALRCVRCTNPSILGLCFNGVIFHWRLRFLLLVVRCLFVTCCRSHLYQICLETLAVGNILDLWFGDWMKGYGGRLRCLA